jgi:hypothetical protein
MELSRLLRIEIESGLDPPSMTPERLLEENHAPVRIFEPLFLCHREIGPRVEEHAGKHTDATSQIRVVLAEDLDPLHPAARGSSFENEAVKAGLLEPVDLFTGEALHPLGEVLSRLHLDQPWVVTTVDELDRWPRHAEPELDLWAHRHPLEPLSNHIREIAIVLVTAVVSNLGAKQTGRDTEADRPVLVVFARPQFGSLFSVHGTMMPWPAHSPGPPNECYS